MQTEDTPRTDFIRDIIRTDLSNGKNNGRVHTRFPPEPNGYLHIGHAKAICINFEVAREFCGLCNLRFDDTNPQREDVEYEESIIRDIRWLGFDWQDRLFYASDYFERFYELAVDLIQRERAYVCSLGAEKMREYRGTAQAGKSGTGPGKDSPYRNRSVEENLDLFERMKNGEFDEGTHVLRAKIDMAHPNLNMRDPVIYRIMKVPHARTGDKWNIYPMYDFAHCVSDSLEGITHSLCSLEFENHRPLYDWFLEELGLFHSQQIEFARLNLGFTIMSKRKMIRLVDEDIVNGWDDPRLLTLAGLRRRGYTPASIRNFCMRIGISKVQSRVDMALLEHSLRDELNKTAQRAMAVLDPVKLVIDNYPEGKEEMLDAVNNPEDPEAGKRQVPFSRELYIERDDFMEDPPKKFYRMAPGREVRLRYAYFVTCSHVVKDPQSGEILEIHCEYDPATRGGDAPDGRKVKATIHWVSAAHAIESEARLYDRLFLCEDPDDTEDGNDFTSNINPDSLQTVTAVVEPFLSSPKPFSIFQFERKGYFCTDSDTTDTKPVFNRAVSLRDTWAKFQKQQQQQKPQKNKNKKKDRE